MDGEKCDHEPTVKKCEKKDGMSMRKINLAPIRSVERAIEILNCFTFEHHQLSIEEIMQKTGLAKATAYRLLWTLEKNGLVHYDGKENVYRLGYKMAEYGGIVLENLDIRREAEPFLTQLHQETKQTIVMAVRQEDTFQYLFKYDSDDGFQPLSYVGKRRLLHYGALGTIFMAYLPPEEAEKILEKYPLVAHTPHTITDKNEYLSRLQKVREQGYFIDVDETFIGFTAISAPVMNAKREVIAAVAIAGPSFRFAGAARAEYLHLLRKTASNISQRLGYVE
ncbi:DNA-binding transcriptional regulator KdgR [Bacillaceae bacterium]